MREGDRAFGRPPVENKSHQPGQNTGAGAQSGTTVPATHGRPDLAFCLPVAVKLNHTDYTRLVIVALHGVALWIVMAFLPAQIALATGLLCCCSLRYGLLQQALLSGYHSLECDRSGQWYITIRGRNRQWVGLEQLQMSGPLLLLRLRHFGGTVFWISFQHRQDASQWGRLRVLGRLL